MDTCLLNRSVSGCLSVAFLWVALTVPCSGVTKEKLSLVRGPNPKERARMVFKAILYSLHQTSGDHRPWLFSVPQKDAGNLELLNKDLRAQGFSKVEPTWMKSDTAHKHFFYAAVEGWNPAVKGRTSIRMHVLSDNHRSEVLHESYETVAFKHGKSGWQIDRHASKVEVGE